MNLKTMIDPPSGWMYGFPKEYTKKPDEDFNEWLVHEGYPQKLIDEFGAYLYCRYWDEERT